MPMFPWIFVSFFLCVSRCHLASPTLVLRVQVGQNVTLRCNLTSGVDVTWWLLRSGSWQNQDQDQDQDQSQDQDLNQQLVPLLTVTVNKIGKKTIKPSNANRRMSVDRARPSGAEPEAALDLQVVQVQEEDSGWYFCTGRCREGACSDQGWLLSVRGAVEKRLRQEEEVSRPCWKVLVFVVFPASLVLLLVLGVLVSGVLLYPGKTSAKCGCASANSGDSALHYSSLRHLERPRPSSPGGGGVRAVDQEVTYATVANRTDPSRSHDLGGI